MGKPLTWTLPLLLLNLMFIPTTYALESKVEVRTTGENSSVSVQQNIQSQNSTTIQSNSQNSVSIHQSGGDNNSVKIVNNRFTISGKATQVSDSQISVSGQKVVIDKSKVSNFQQTGTINIGSQVTVEGPVINGTLYAEKIYSGTPTATNNPTSTPAATSSPVPTSLATSSPEASVEGEATVAAEIKEVNQSIIQVIERIFTQILNSLRSIF